MPTLNDEQRRQHVIAGELQRVLQREREAEAVHEPEAERDRPARARVRADDVLDAPCRRSTARSAFRRAAGTTARSAPAPYADAISVTECPAVNAVTIHTSARSCRRNGTTRQSRNKRWSAPSRMCSKPCTRNLSSDWCQRGSSATTPASPSIWNTRSTPLAPKKRTALTTRMPSRCVRAFSENSELADSIGASSSTSSNACCHGKVEAGRQRRRAQVRERRFVLGKRAIARDRRPHADDRERHAPLAFVELEVVDEPELRGVAQLLLRARHIEIARPERRERDVLHRLERRAHEHLHALAFRAARACGP